MNSTQYKGELTKDKIVNAALKLFAEKGFDQVSLQMIAAEVGISQAAVSQHFGNKRNIIMKVRESVTKSNRSFVDGKINIYEPYFEQLTQHCVNNIVWSQIEKQFTQILILTYYFSFSDEVFKCDQTIAVKNATERIEKYVIGYFHNEKSANKNKIKTISEEIHRWILGYFLRDASICNSPEKETHLKKEVISFLQRILK